MSNGRLVDSATATHTDVLTWFIRKLSPGRKVRRARYIGEDSSRVHANGGAVWANSYPDVIDRDEVDGTAPVAMYLAGFRNRKGGRRGDRYRVYLYVVFELDVSNGGRDAVRRDAAGLVALLALYGIKAVPVVSGPGGGMHVWASCPQGLPAAVVARIADAAKALFPTVDRTPLLNPASGAVRPPGAPHRHGGHAEFAEHSAHEAITILQRGAPASAFVALLRGLEAQVQASAAVDLAHAALGRPRSRRTSGDGWSVPPSIQARGPVVRPVTTDEDGVPRLDVPWRPLSAAVRHLAQHRPSSTPGAHQAAVHPVLRALAAVGWDRLQAAAFAADPDLSPALEWLRTASTATGDRAALTEAEAETRLARAWWLAVADAARMPRRSADNTPGTEQADDPGAAAAADLIARMDACAPARWTRPGGPADRAVLRALAWLMAAYGLTEVTASVRRIAVLAAYSKSTAALALLRVTWDGWIETAKDADRPTASGRRIRLAEAHQCTGDEHHMCAPYDLTTARESAGHHGSDRSGTPRPPRGGVGILPRLDSLIAHQQAGIWHRFGHHAARTLEIIRDHPAGLSPEEITQHSGYRGRTTVRHCGKLLRAGLVRLTAEGTVVPTDKSLYAAGAEQGVALRTVELATVARVEQSVHLWWCREEAWWQLERSERRRQERRASADQEVLPGLDPYARAYPRHAPAQFGEPGDADHARAFAIEAVRINAAQLAAEAAELARTGRVIDPARLGTLPAPTHGQATAA